MNNIKRTPTYQYIQSGTCLYGLRCKFSHNKYYANHTPKPVIQDRKFSQVQSQCAGNIDRFFARYPKFVYDSSAPIWMEFDRLCNQFGWNDDDCKKREAKRQFKSAMVQEFNVIYGTDEKNLDSWQKLCYVLNIEPVPGSLKACRKRVLQVHVNLVDLVEIPRTGAPVNIFSNLKELQKYTIENEKFFPKEDAYAGGLLKFLLREIF